MKKIVTTALALVLTLGMGVTAFATPSVSTDVKASDATDSKGNKVEVTVTVATEEVKTEAAAKATELVGEGSSVLATVDVTLPTAVSKENPVTITFSVPGVKAGDAVSVLHQKHDGTWEKLAGTAGDGTVTVTFTELSPIAFVLEKAAAPAGDVPNPAANDIYLNNNNNTTTTQAGVTSPKTGEAGVFGFALAAVACGAALVCVNKKKTA